MKRLVLLALLGLGACDCSDCGKCTEIGTSRTLYGYKLDDVAWVLQDENGLQVGVTPQNSEAWHCELTNKR